MKHFVFKMSPKKLNLVFIYLHLLVQELGHLEHLKPKGLILFSVVIMHKDYENVCLTKF